MSKRSIVIPIVVLAIACGLFLTIRFGWPSWKDGADVQQTDDAYVRADQTPLSTRISGTVRKVNLGDYSSVHTGQLLVELEDSDYQATVAEAKAALDGAKAEFAANQNAKQVADAAITSARDGIHGSEALVSAAQADIEGAKASVRRAQSEFHRQQALLAKRAATQQHFEEAQEARDRSLALLAGKEAELSRVGSSLEASRATLAERLQQRAALSSKDGVLLAQIEAKKAAITVAEVNLGYTKIYSPTTGKLGEFRIHPGQLVGAGIQVVDLVQSGIWIQANYRETQLERVVPGDAADVQIDALHGHHFQGHVEDISPASGSQFALLPPDNATGNFTKIVQRIPVRIMLDPSQETSQLRPGFSAVVKIHTAAHPAVNDPANSLKGER